MKSNIYSLRKSRSIEIPVASMISPESELNVNTPYTRPSTSATSLPRINLESHPPSPNLCYDSLGLAEVDKETKKEGAGLDLPDVQNSKCLATFCGMQQEGTNNPRDDSEIPERPFKVSKLSELLQDRIRLLESEVEKYLTEAQEVIQQAVMEKKRERASSSFSGASIGSVQNLPCSKYSTKNLCEVHKHKNSMLKYKETAAKSHLPGGKRLQKIKTDSFTSKATPGRKLPSQTSKEQNNSETNNGSPRERNDSNQKNSIFDNTVERENGKFDLHFHGEIGDKKEENEDGRGENVICLGLLDVTEQGTGEKNGGLEENRVQYTAKTSGTTAMPQSILNQAKTGALKPNNLTKSVTKTVQQLYKLNRVKDAENLSDLLESKLMAENELKRAIKRELQEEMEEKERLETKNIEKSRRQAFFQRMEELGRLEEKMRETRIRERERRRAEAWLRREKNVALRNEQQTSILSAKISRAFKFSYFPLLIQESRSTSSYDEQSSSSSEDSGRSSPDCDADSDASVSRQTQYVHTDCHSIRSKK